MDKHPKPLHPVLLEFKTLVEGDTRLFMLFEAMFQQVSEEASCAVIRDDRKATEVMVYRPI